MKQKLTTTMFGVIFLLAFQFVNATIEPATIVKPVIKQTMVSNQAIVVAKCSAVSLTNP